MAETALSVRAMRTVFMVIALIVTSTASIAATPSQGRTSPTLSAVTASGFCPDAEERAFLKLINNYRASKGLKAMRFTKTLGASAEHHSVDMANKNYFSHTLSGGITWSTNIKNHGYTFNTYRGENIAAGNSSASATFSQWKNSAGHNANMLNPAYTAIGIGRGYNVNAKYDWYWTTTFGGYQDAAIAC